MKRRRETYALQLKSGRWYLHYSVPKILQPLPHFRGKTIYVKTLETSDLREAIIKRDAALAQFKLLADQMAQEPKRSRFNAMIEEIQEAVRASQQKLPTTIWQGNESAEIIHEDLYDAYDVENSLARGDEVEADAIRYVLEGEKGIAAKYELTLREAVNAYLNFDSKQDPAKRADPATLSRMRNAANSLCEFMRKKDPRISTIERRDVTLWLQSLEEVKRDSTRVGYLSALSLLWEWCYLHKNASGDNPFKNANVRSTGGSQSYEPFTVEEMVKILKHSDHAMKTLSKFGLLTGCRIGELVALTDEDFEVNNGVHLVRIRQGKTANSIRAIPLPAAMWAELKEIVIAGVWVGNRGSKAAGVSSHKFGRLKGKALGNRDRTKGFHSFRGMTITAYQRAGVPEDVTAAIVGHSKKGLTMSYGLYSSGYDYKHQLQAVEGMIASPYMQQFLSLFTE
ncbi:tyrosine-type recombinase/integrase [Aeromonas veronii]|uniref:tyrosine-type recombinase/integrase n=1 Tax=Aeromonas veronii TaxID=654 RepID=UPI001F2F816F|nr:tyrosine-type recombinase/integrase [Aeromonas veronii]